MTKSEFIQRYLISRAYLHSTDGLTEYMQNLFGDLDKNNPEDAKSIEKGDEYSQRLEREISHAFELADLISNTIADFDKPKAKTNKKIDLPSKER